MKRVILFYILVATSLCFNVYANTVLTAKTPILAFSKYQTGTFSNLKSHAETGDLLGCEIKIIYSSEGYKALVLLAQGSAGVARLADAVFDKNRITIAFTDHPYGLQTLRGTITQKWIDVELIFDKGSVESHRLFRKKSYWD